MKIRSKTFANLYEEVLSHVYTCYDNIVQPRGIEIKECTNMVLELTNPYSNLFLNSVRSVPLRYLCGELYWYFTGKRDVEFISQYSKFWNQLSNHDRTVNSAYGYMLFERGKPFITEWNWAFESLFKDKDTRQAILHFNIPHHFEWGTKDFPCTLSGTFQIRNDKLNFTVVMRSQDVIKGLTFDLPFFTLLQQNMHLSLKEKYKSLRMGSLTLIAQSEHLYKDDYMLARKMLLNNHFDEDRLPVMQLPLVVQTSRDNKYAFNHDDCYNDELCKFIMQHAEIQPKQRVLVTP